jgi:hypothetical protein
MYIGDFSSGGEGVTLNLCVHWTGYHLLVSERSEDPRRQLNQDGNVVSLLVLLPQGHLHKGSCSGSEFKRITGGHSRSVHVAAPVRF